MSGNKYQGSERRDRSGCPMTIKEVMLLDKRLGALETKQVNVEQTVISQGRLSKAELDRVSKSIEQFEKRFSKQLDELVVRFDETLKRVFVETDAINKRIERSERLIHDIEVKSAAAKGYVEGGIVGAKTGVKVGAVMVIGAITAAVGLIVSVVYSTFTDKAHILNLFRYFSDKGS